MTLLITTELAREREKSAGSSRSAPSQGLMEELQISRSERDDAISRERTLKQSLSSLELDKKVSQVHSQSSKR